MALRLIEVVLPKEQALQVRPLFHEDIRDGPWIAPLEGGYASVRVLVEAEESGDIVDELEHRFGGLPEFRLLIQSIEATLPRSEEKEAAPVPVTKTKGLAREELLTNVTAMAKPTNVFFVTVALSTVVVAVGLFQDNPAVIIGAMVIAPLLGPNVALALATTLADTKLLALAVKANLWGILIALALTIPLGAIANVDPETTEIARRTSTHWSDIILALAAGSAAALALTTGVPAALVGVMVAVALLPPTAVLGLMIGSGNSAAAVKTAMLLATNVICVNLAGTVTFQLEGIRPRIWWEAERAARSARHALIIELILLAVLATLILLG